MLASTAMAQPTSTRPASILFFPHVVADETLDTIIQIGNTGNFQQDVRCFYRQAPDGDVVAGFRIRLTRQQPTHWVASQGRMPTGEPNVDVGTIPAIPAPFRGLLICVLVDAAGFLLPSNSIVGHATIQSIADADTEKYAAIGMRGFDTNDGGDELCLGGGSAPGCPFGSEYDGCAAGWMLDHASYEAGDGATGVAGEITTEVTVVACEQDLNVPENRRPVVQFLTTNEFEQQFSGATTMEWGVSTPLIEINSVFARATLGTDRARTRFQSAPGANPGVVIVGREIRRKGGSTRSTAAINLYPVGERGIGDTITLPPPF